MLLRADIHTLYDLNQIGIDENGTVFVSEQLRESEYWSLHKKIVMDNIHPLMQENLTKRFQRFRGSNTNGEKTYAKEFQPDLTV